MSERKKNSFKNKSSHYLHQRKNLIILFKQMTSVMDNVLNALQILASVMLIINAMRSMLAPAT
jgi:hypothetical protein